MEQSTLKVLEDVNMSLDDVSLIVPHQANIRIIEGATKRLGVSPEKVFVNLISMAICPPHPYLLHWMRQLKTGL
jgi:3-oxoacyl-[acyl-carrier-protein] synthase III